VQYLERKVSECVMTLISLVQPIGIGGMRCITQSFLDGVATVMIAIASGIILNHVFPILNEVNRMLIHTLKESTGMEFTYPPNPLEDFTIYFVLLSIAGYIGSFIEAYLRPKCAIIESASIIFTTIIVSAIVIRFTPTIIMDAVITLVVMSIGISVRYYYENRKRRKEEDIFWW